jgi:MFS transporter, Spinster family, sphingosine-1-phosphate transporter
MSAPVSPASPGPSAIAPQARLALLLLLSINLFNYIDRQVLSAVLPKLELDANLFSPTDPWLKTKLGSLTTAFLVTYMFVSPIFGSLSNRLSRWWLVGIGVIVWSLASGGSGLATGFWMLLITRCLVGIGEAAYGPVAPSMLSDMYPVEKRGRIMAIFYMAIPVGSALGFVIGGMVANTSWGWPGSFQIVVIPGILLGLLCFTMRETRQHQQTVGVAPPKWGAVLKELRGIRSFVLCCTGMTCTTFVLGGVAAWAPYYIFEREARFQITPKNLAEIRELKASDGTPVVPPKVVDGLEGLASDAVYTTGEFRAKLAESPLTPDEQHQYRARFYEKLTAPESIALHTIDFRFGAIVAIGGLVATMLGGWLGERLRKRYRGAYFLVCGYGALIAFPCFLGMLFVPFPYAWVLVFLTVFFLFVNTGPANTILANVVRSPVRAAGFAVNILVIHLLGDAISPPLMGFVADLSSLHVSMLLTSAFIVVGGILWLLGAASLDRETDAVTRADAAAAPKPD